MVFNILEVTLPTLTQIFGYLTNIFETVINSVTSVVGTLIGNNLFLVPVLICLAGGICTVSVKIVRKLGLNGIGRRRKARGRR